MSGMATLGFVPAGDRHQLASMNGNKKLSAALLPPLELTRADEYALRCLAEDLEREVVEVYEEFVRDHDHRVDTLRWKSVRSQDGLKVYCERDVEMRSINRLQPFFPSGKKPTQQALGPQGSMAANTRVPLKMATGTVPGSLDDALFGGAIHDTPSMKIRSEYQHEVMADAAVLHVIDDASDDDPFQFFGVVWYLKSMAIPGVSDRDMLLLSRIRTSQLSNGEKIGVHLYHSIQHADLPPLDKFSVLRMNVSLVVIFRQLTENSVDVFMLDIVDAMGSTPTLVNTQEAARTLLASGNICATGVTKKLHWCMRENQRKQRATSRGRGLTVTVQVLDDHTANKNCHVCKKSTKGLFRSSGCICHLCRKRTCSKCTTTKKIILSATETETESKSFDFCRVCMFDVQNRSTFEIARAEMYERRMFLSDRKMSDRPHSDTPTVTSFAVSPSA